MTDVMSKLPEDFIQLARTALAGRPQDIQLLIHRASKRYKETIPSLTEGLVALMRESPSRSSPLRKQMDIPLPVDLDSRLQLLRVETSAPEYNPILSNENNEMIQQVLSERQNSTALFKHGLQPTRSMLFTGPPGVGKTLAAKWIASQLNRPLLILDLAAVMSSYLGRTGNNIRFVLDYAKSIECVLLIDELDAIAKRRDDSGEIGELKRLVTVLLQEIDDWPASGLLLAATNHPDLLDPAVWRRFEAIVRFGIPVRAQVEALIKRLLKEEFNDRELWCKVLSYMLVGKSFSEVERQINLFRKSAAISGKQIHESIELLIGSNQFLSRDERIELAVLLYDKGILSQRQATEMTGVARETIRKHTEEKKDSVVLTTSKTKSHRTKPVAKKVIKKVKKPKAYGKA